MVLPKYVKFSFKLELNPLRLNASFRKSKQSKVPSQVNSFSIESLPPQAIESVDLPMYVPTSEQLSEKNT